MHSPEPLSASELLKEMPTDKSITQFYEKLPEKSRVDKSIPGWGDAIVWSEFHHASDYPVLWD